jgi:hypothetical protein
MVDALLRRYVFLSTLNAKLLGFKYVKELYMNDGDFANVFYDASILFDSFTHI